MDCRTLCYCCARLLAAYNNAACFKTNITDRVVNRQTVALLWCMLVLHGDEHVLHATLQDAGAKDLDPR